MHLLTLGIRDNHVNRKTALYLRRLKQADGDYRQNNRYDPASHSKAALSCPSRRPIVIYRRRYLNTAEAKSAWEWTWEDEWALTTPKDSSTPRCSKIILLVKISQAPEKGRWIVDIRIIASARMKPKLPLLKITSAFL